MSHLRIGHRSLSSLSLAGLLLVGACASAARPPAPVGRAPTAAEGTRVLPPVPQVLGNLAIDVVYPPEGANIAVRDNTFIFGNVGRGDATLTINGQPVEVAANGAWLAYLPVPPNGVYELAASAGGQTVTATRTVQVPGPPAAALGDGSLRIVPGSVTPGSAITGVRGERIEVSFRGSPGGVARLVLPDGRSIPLVERAAIERTSGFMLNRTETSTGVSEYVGTLELTTDLLGTDRSALPTLTDGGVGLPVPPGGGEAFFELTRGVEVVRMPIPATIGVLDPARPRVAVAATDRPDAIVIGRRAPGADQAWDFFWPNGTLFAIDGERSGYYRVRLTPELTAWVTADEVTLLPVGTPSPQGYVGPSIQLVPRERFTEIRFSMSEPLPFRIDPAEWGATIEFYGATGRPAYVGYGQQHDFVRRVDWEQRTDELYRFNVHLDRPLWGFRSRWEGNYLVVEVREPPAVDPTNPLAGLRIAVDAGHKNTASDQGAIGPTRLTEAEATLAVASRLAALLRERGADVVEIRPDENPVALIDRPIIADQVDADLLVSIHFNAFPDGVDPFANHGTSMFYFWPHSLGFARHLQREIVGELGLPDRGVRYQNLGMTRTPWMPAILTESMFMMFPRQEAALRDPALIERLAGAHLRAMESFVRERATLTAAPGPSAP